MSYLGGTERRRRCGFRKIGGLYLVGDGVPAECGLLPYPLTTCPTCGHGVKPSRGFTWLSCDFFDKTLCPKDCRQLNACPLYTEKEMGLIWVGEQYYPKTQDFLKEAVEMGVSRRIYQIPLRFKIGETWILLAHRKAIASQTQVASPGEMFEHSKTEYTPAIFAMFKPSRIEKILTQDMATEKELESLGKRNITPVVVPDTQQHRTGRS